MSKVTELFIKPITIELPIGGEFKGVLWNGMVGNWRHNITFSFMKNSKPAQTFTWIGELNNTSSN